MTSRVAVTCVLAVTVFAGSAIAGDTVVTESRKITASDGQPGDQFGRSIAVDGNRMIVGAHLDDDNGVDSGSAYTHFVSSGIETGKLLPIFGALNAEFGTAVALMNGSPYVGAPLSIANNTNAGAMFVFDAMGNAGPIFASSDIAPDDQFGYSIAADQNYIVVGAWGNQDSGLFTGAVYVFSALSGFELHKIVPADATMNNFIGWDVAIEDGVIAIGSPVNFVDGIEVGAVYLFDASTAVQLDKLSPDDPGGFDQFGYSVAMEDGIVVVGSRFDDDHGTDSGAIYLFDAATGAQTHKLLPDITGRLGGNLGQDVSIKNGVVAGGSPGESGLGNIEAGAAYLFESFTGNQIARVLVSNGDTGDAFGTSVALHSNRLTVGAPMEDEMGDDAGAVYQFFLPGSGCEADINYDGSLNFFDVSQFINAFNAQHPTADFDDNGIWNFFDISVFLKAFNDC